MDIENIKKNYKWDPLGGDYSKSYASYERRISRRKKNRNLLFISFYIVVLVAGIIVLYKTFK